MNYIALKNNQFSLNTYLIVPLRNIDIFKIKQWRNAQIDVLRQKKPLTNNDQKNYYNNVIKPTFSQKYPSQILFSFLNENECIGYGGLTNIDWEAKRIELSYLVNPNRLQPNLYKKEFSVFLSLIKKVVFEELKFNRIFTETYDIRPVHIDTLEKNGFKREGILKQHVIINGKFVDSIIHGFIKKNYDSERKKSIC